MGDYVGECNIISKACTECLHYGLLDGETSRQALDPVGPVAHFVQLFLNEAPREKWITRIINPPLYFGDVHQIYAVAKDAEFTHLSLYSQASAVPQWSEALGPN